MGESASRLFRIRKDERRPWSQTVTFAAWIAGSILGSSPRTAMTVQGVDLTGDGEAGRKNWVSTFVGMTRKKGG